MEERIGVVFL